ncbi:TetR/AcrR family transcriptional regulator [Photobacterium sp. OFAV2-7]|uniref:TetR/AcrR family transcriptional regulator n=1 Tax=Photobacterium sp. OFAV2-7 TaxID=2917748 RepID=UPI001EF4617F|nr:TetR/AcrR family transcriptional regulator [Photobacterium sp. OFAV2-7]MCG7587953.1 TetR/AcrR family transcriptional regulator [Photobacterium sp. OFAV2-7]
MSRKKRDTSAKRESILIAAIDAFIEFGFDKTSMDLIAERSNASKRTVYNHFSSKESLIEEAFNQFLRGAFESKNIEYDPNRSIEDQLGDFADSKMGLTEDPRQLGLMRVTLCAFITHPQLAERAVLFSDSQDDGLVKWLTEATQDGRLNVHDPELAAESFWSLFSGTFFWPPIVRGPVEKKAGQKLKTEFIQLFLARYGKQ